LLFILLNSANLLRPGDTGIPYPVYVILGTVSFALFLDALNMPLNAIAAARWTLPKINFPHEALLLAGIAQILFSFMVKSTLIIAVLVIYRVPVSLSAVLVVIPLMGLLLAGLALGVGLYSYAFARLLVPFLVIGFVAVWWWELAARWRWTLAGAIPADQSQRLAPADRERHVAKRPELIRPQNLSPMRATGELPREVLHPVHERMPETAAELLGDAVDLDHWLVAHQVPIRSMRIGIASRNTTHDSRSPRMLAPTSMRVVTR
jgi:hypothetical protein